jgi:hypothetical protein
MLVREAFTSPYVRIFELTAFGKDHLRKQGRIKISENKIINLQSLQGGELK